MSATEPGLSRRKLPPLDLGGSEAGSLDRTPRKKKRKHPAPSDASDVDSPKRALPKPGSTRSLSASETKTETARSSQDKPARPKPKRPKTTTYVTDTLQDIEGQDEAPVAPKKRPKSKATGSREELVENGSVVADDQLTNRSASDQKKKKKKKKKAEVSPSIGIGLERELQELEDDIVTDPADSFDENRYGATAFMRSEPLNKLFIEQKSGFKAASKEKIARKRALNQQQQAMAATETVQTKSTIQFAISSQNVFRTFVLFLQGILAGLCLWQIVTVYLLSNQGYDVLLEQYKTVAMPVQCIYYFLMALSTVAVFDKNDIARPTRSFVIRSLTMQTTAIACLFYLTGLVISLSIANIDDRISQYDPEQSPWEDTAARDSQLKKWVILNLVRGLMPQLGWFVISISPKSDRLIENLEKADDNILEGLQTNEQDTALRSSGV